MPSSLAQDIAPHLPYLRRYARALTGSQTSGDAHVTACLEALVADPAVFDPGLGAKVGLYRLFHQLWSSVQLDPGRDDAPRLGDRAHRPGAPRRDDARRAGWCCS